MEMSWILGRIERNLSSSGHEIVWDLSGKHLAHGHCESCHATIRVNVGHDGGYAIAGDCRSAECARALSRGYVLC